MTPTELLTICEKMYAALKVSEVAGRLGAGSADRLLPIVMDKVLEDERLIVPGSFKL